MSEREPGAFDRLVRSAPSQVANFALSSDIVRSSVASAGEVLVILPERGALPIFWAADGYSEEEKTMVVDGTITLPIGTFDFENPQGKIKKGTLSRDQKESIIGRFDSDISGADRILLIDEVQHGGTITEVVDIVNRRRGSNSSKRMYVVAAQDSRKKVSSGRKKDKYQKMVSGNTEGVSANVVPMPLVATDSDALLNRLWYPGSTRVPTEIRPEIEIIENLEAQLVFRLLGMAVRNREALEDTSVLDDNLFSLPLGDKASRRVEEWREVLLKRLKARVDVG